MKSDVGLGCLALVLIAVNLLVLAAGTVVVVEVLRLMGVVA